MKVVILAGGFGTRISEESQVRPKPMVEIGGKPILWHIMKEYSYYDCNEFIICAGYKQHIIKEYFASYALHNSNVTFDFQGEESIHVHTNFAEPWKVTIVDTGYDTPTGVRLKQIEPYVQGKDFLMTYGDGVADVDIKALIRFHREHGKCCTITATKPESRFGFLDLDGDEVLSFREKSQNDVGYINSGYMVLGPEVFKYIKGNVMFEQEPMKQLTKDHQVVAYKHHGFWQCMDTLRDKKRLEKLWESGKAPWKLW